ncbi:hypothetical protein C8R45DRAFT_321680 [Mycena sanguinolenta]|nr:hypothetical protein C8R45DRAFT_321680 [Mycena sanguinolenta]
MQAFDGENPRGYAQEPRAHHPHASRHHRSLVLAPWASLGAWTQHVAARTQEQERKKNQAQHEETTHASRRHTPPRRTQSRGSCTTRHDTVDTTRHATPTALPSSIRIRIPVLIIDPASISQRNKKEGREKKCSRMHAISEDRSLHLALRPTSPTHSADETVDTSSWLAAPCSQPQNQDAQKEGHLRTRTPSKPNPNKSQMPINSGPPAAR